MPFYDTMKSNDEKQVDEVDTINPTILEFFSRLGFAEIPIEDDLTGLCFEESPEGEYALVTNEEGLLPVSLDAPLLIAFYTPEGAFLWSTGFKNAGQFEEIWLQGATYAEKMQATAKHRELMLAASQWPSCWKGLDNEWTHV